MEIPQLFAGSLVNSWIAGSLDPPPIKTAILFFGIGSFSGRDSILIGVVEILYVLGQISDEKKYVECKMKCNYEKSFDYRGVGNGRIDISR